MKTGEVLYFYPGWCHTCQRNFTSRKDASIPTPCPWCGSSDVVKAKKKAPPVKGAPWLKGCSSIDDLVEVQSL
jgi:DNA-directed RNA polymerase subunit RPC12/RpoP